MKKKRKWWHWLLIFMVIIFTLNMYRACLQDTKEKAIKKLKETQTKTKDSAKEIRIIAFAHVMQDCQSCHRNKYSERSSGDCTIFKRPYSKKALKYFYPTSTGIILKPWLNKKVEEEAREFQAFIDSLSSPKGD